MKSGTLKGKAGDPAMTVGCAWDSDGGTYTLFQVHTKQGSSSRVQDLVVAVSKKLYQGRILRYREEH